MTEIDEKLDSSSMVPDRFVSPATIDNELRVVLCTQVNTSSHGFERFGFERLGVFSDVFQTVHSQFGRDSICITKSESEERVSWFARFDQIREIITGPTLNE